MIRSNLPLPFLYRLRLQAGAAGRRAPFGTAGYRAEAGNAGAGLPPNARPHAARRLVATGAGQFWEEFIDEYERFTGVLCAAAQWGCDGRKESEYAQLRRWFVTHYYRIAGRIRPYLDAESASEDPALQSQAVIADYAGRERSLDALEALFLPPTLRDVLCHDTGNLLPRIARISEAVYRCHDEWQAAQP